MTPAIRVESTYRDMTPDKARGTNFRFGFAASYRVGGGTAETTLYDLREFNAGCAIENRVRPGSCQRSTAVAHAAGDTAQPERRLRVEDLDRAPPR